MSQRQTISTFAGLELFADFPVAVFALNASRQIVYMNERGRTLLARPQAVGIHDAPSLDAARAGVEGAALTETPD